jgi:hypothetical protein
MNFGYNSSHTAEIKNLAADSQINLRICGCFLKFNCLHTGSHLIY